MLWACLPPPHATSRTSPTPGDDQLRGLAVWGLQYTPRVALLRGAVVLEVEASPRLFGGRRALPLTIEGGAVELGVAVAWAPNAPASLALVRSGVAEAITRPLAATLDPLPLASLDAIAAHATTFARLGCQTLADVRALPRSGFVRRFGSAVLAGLDRAYGLRPEAHEWVVLPETFRSRLELMSRVETAPALLFGARRLLLQLGGWLAARHAVTTTFVLRWAHDAMRSRVDATLATPPAPALATRSAGRRTRGSRLPQPAFLLAEPLRLAVRREGPVRQGPLRLPVGPHRVEGEWWDRVDPGAVAAGGVSAEAVSAGAASKPSVAGDRAWGVGLLGWDGRSHGIGRLRRFIQPSCGPRLLGRRVGPCRLLGDLPAAAHRGRRERLIPAGVIRVTTGSPTATATPGAQPPSLLPTSPPHYAELRCCSNFSFLEGASWPEELVERAKQLGYSALALTDECMLAGVVRAHVAAKEHGIRLLLGSQFRIRGEWPLTLTALACNLDGYGNLCEFITARRRSAPKGEYRVDLADVTAAALERCCVLLSPDREAINEQLGAACAWLASTFQGRGWLAVEVYRVLDDAAWLERLEATGVPLVASGDVLMHVRSRKTVQDVLVGLSDPSRLQSDRS